MSTRTITITYKICDGCGRSNREGGLPFAASRPRYGWQEFGITLDICEDCATEDKYICRLCNAVHDDAHPCEKMRLELEQAETDIEGFVKAPDTLPY